MPNTKSDSYWTDHLLRRAGFGTTLQEQSYYKQLGYDGTLKELLHPETVKDDAMEKIVYDQNFDYNDLGDLRRWWIYRMMFTRRPLAEKLCLFWHGHFATSNNGKVNNAYLMYQQNQIFRNQGLGNFQDLLLSVSKDPAMIVYLDNQQNTKNKPNENYAREVMELFTMGIGNYSETDVKEAARAFTGWMAPSGFYFNRKQHDVEKKTFLGESGNFGGEDIVRILAARPETAHFISRKLITYFCMDDPSDSFVDKVAASYMSKKQDIRSVMETIFTSPEFHSDKAYHCKIKSPAEYVIGTMKLLQVDKIDGDLPAVMARMGQNLFEPPNVKGWDGGMAWIATDTLMERFNFAARISTQKFDAKEGYINPTVLASQYGTNSAKDMVDHFLARLVDEDVPTSARKQLLAYVATDLNGQEVSTLPDAKTVEAKMRGLLHLIMTLPSYQLA
ncbi:MAG: DUF1800 family protein [Cyanobacteria bacterium REEB67]|nr:DUF1800 family protein [Cyanobacteria bacterium REEB67]